jgi:monovalent cation/hydrogen antiporter
MATKPRADCPHINAIPTTPTHDAAAGCAECGALSPTRVCLTCGHVGCCDSTRGHATAHAHASGHPLIRALPLSAGSFTWCYECNAYLQ